MNMLRCSRPDASARFFFWGRERRKVGARIREAYTKRAYPAVLVLAIVTMAYGIIDFLNFFVVSMAMVDLVFLVIFLIVLFGYMIYTSKLKKKYFRPY